VNVYPLPPRLASTAAPTTTAAAVTTAAAATTTAAKIPSGFRSRFVNHERSPFHLKLMELVDCFLCVLV
jgi:hypothetical protein